MRKKLLETTYGFNQSLQSVEDWAYRKGNDSSRHTLNQQYKRNDMKQRRIMTEKENEEAQRRLDHSEKFRKLKSYMRHLYLSHV